MTDRNDAVGTKEGILKAAIRVLGEKGYSDLSMKDVAEASGFTKPTIYYYFRNKEGLLLAIVDHVNSLIEGFLERELLSDGQVSASLERIAAAMIRAHRDNPDFARAHLACHADSGVKALFPSMMGRFARIEGLMSDLMKRGVERGEFRKDVPVQILCRTFTSILHMTLKDPSAGTATAPSAGEMVGILMRGIGR